MSASITSEAERTEVESTNHGSSHDSIRRPIPWQSCLVLAILIAVMSYVTSYQSLRRYQELRSGWSWDLAYYNQWFWCLTHGHGEVTVRAVSAYAHEGPSIWKMNYLAPIRLVLAPIYWVFPGPRVLLVIQNVLFWWVILAAYTLVRSESRSELASLLAAMLVPLTPLFWPLVGNDFRELQLAPPFVLWAVQGIRGRSAGCAALGIGGMLACRQEYAVMVASFAFLPPRQPESLTVTLKWRRTLFLVGLVWFVAGFFGYLKLVVGRHAPDLFIEQFMGPKAPIVQTLGTSLETLLFGMGAWALLACLVPRVAILALPWIWGTCSERWAMRILSTAEWHSVRYTMPMAAIVLAAGLIGFARLADGLVPRRGGRAMLITAWLCAAVFCGLGLRDVGSRWARAPVLIDPTEAQQIWSWIRQVGRDDAVLVDYEFSAPLSSRRLIFGCELDVNLPGRDFPRLAPEFRWLFIRNTNRFYKLLLAQGFEVVHRGQYATVARRGATVAAQNSDFLEFFANTNTR